MLLWRGAGQTWYNFAVRLLNCDTASDRIDMIDVVTHSTLKKCNMLLQRRGIHEPQGFEQQPAPEVKSTESGALQSCHCEASIQGCALIAAYLVVGHALLWMACSGLLSLKHAFCALLSAGQQILAHGAWCAQTCGAMALNPMMK